MGLLRRGLKHERLPRFSGAHYWTIFTLGRELGEWSHGRAEKSLGQLKQLPGATSNDLNDVVRAARTILELTRELDRLDERLQLASHLELQGCLFGTKAVSSGEFNEQAAADYDVLHERMLVWSESLPESQRLQAQTSIGERRELVLSLLAMCASFDRATSSIEASHRQQRLARSVARLEAPRARPRLPIPEQLEQVQEAEQVAEVVGAGVDAMYSTPALASLGMLPTAASGEQSEPEPEL